MGFTISSRSGGGIAGKIIFSAFGLFFAFIGTQFVKQQWKSLEETKAMQQWVQTTCTIISSEVKDDGEDFRLEVAYRYEVNGEIFTAERYGKQKYSTAETIVEIDRLQKQLPVGKAFNCYYNPAKPSDAVLRLPTLKEARTSLGFTFLFPGFGLLFATLPWLGGRRKAKTRPEPLVKTATKKHSGKWPPIIFGAVFAVIGLLVLKPLVLTPLQKTRAAKTWGTVEATVISSKVKSHTSDDSTTYSPYIAYAYEVGGEEYLGDQYTFMGGSSSGYDSKAAIVRNFPKGSTFNVYVNPDNPAESVINRDSSRSLLLGLIPLAFVAAGVAVMVAGFRGNKTKLDPTQSHQQVVALKGPSPVGKAVGIGLFAVLWDGVVYFLITSDAPLLFPIVFGIFGLIITGAAVHAVLAIFNPRPTVEITPGAIRPGTTVAMRWRTTGRADRIEALTITLQCLRITTETSRSGGKSTTSVVKTPIYTEELLQTDGRNEIAQGTLQFTIKEDQAYSIAGNHSGIRWQLVFHGDIPRWPDLKQELPFTVYPGR